MPIAVFLYLLPVPGNKQIVVSLESLMPWGVGWGWIEFIQVALSMGLGESGGPAHVTMSELLTYPLPFLQATVRSDSLNL